MRYPKFTAVNVKMCKFAVMNVVKVLETFIEEGRRIVKILRNGRDDVQTSKQVTPFGFESNPTSNSIGLYTSTATRNRTYVMGYIAENVDTEVGETRIYSTNDDGEIQISFHFKNDGTVEMGGDADNLMRYNELKSAFDELRDDFNSLVNAYNTHVHPGVTPGNGATVITATTATPSSADMSASKINELKTS